MATARELSGRSGLMPHVLDRHLVAAGIYLSRSDHELEKMGREEEDIPAERQADYERACKQIKQAMESVQKLRIGRKTRRPTTIADVEDLDTYREKFLT